MITDEYINDLIDEAIDHLCDDNAELGAESLVELAHMWAKAGLPRSSFNDMRQHIKRSAIERLGKSSTMFIEYKLNKAEQKLYLQRQGERSGANSGSIIIH